MPEKPVKLEPAESAALAPKPDAPGGKGAQERRTRRKKPNGNAHPAREQTRLAGGMAKLLFAALAKPRCVAAIEDLDAKGVLTGIVPELEASRNCTQNDFHHKPVLAHTFEALANLGAILEFVAGKGGEGEEVDALLGALGRVVLTEFAAKIAGALGAKIAGADPLLVLNLAMLLHDVDKPSTRSERADGRITFYGHDMRGAKTAAAVCERLSLSPDAADAVGVLVRHHLLIGFMAREEASSPRAVRRFTVKLGPLTPHEALLSLSDRLAAQGPSVDAENIRRHFEAARAVLTAYFRPKKIRRPLLSGKDVMKLAGILEGPRVGEILAALDAARVAGTVKSRKAAIAWLASLDQE